MTQLRIFALACLLASSASQLQAQEAGSVTVQVTRMAGPAQRIEGKKSTPLSAGTVLMPGQRVSTGANGRVTLGMGAGQIVVGGDSELYLHSGEILDGAAVMRVVLTHGALQMGLGDSSQPPLDLRLNLGPLRVRALGASLWAAQEPRGETICLLSGTAEVVAEFGTERLYAPGECLWFSAKNRRLLLKPDSAGSALARKLERTEYAPETPVAALEPAEPVPAPPMPLEPALAVTPEPAAVPADPEPAGMPADTEPAAALAAALAAEPPVAAAAPRWTVVVASPASETAAEAYAARLRAQDLDARVSSTSGRNRVCVGSFASKAEAGAYRKDLQQSLQISGAWVLAE